MGKYKISTPSGQVPDRRTYLCAGNVGTETAPIWGRVGKDIVDSSSSMDWQEDTYKDILGDTRTNMKTPIITQTFNSGNINPDDAYQEKILNLSIVDQDAAALCNQDLLRIHLYLKDEDGNPFAERYHSCMVKLTELGGEGGGNLKVSTEVTFGGTREKGTVSMAEDGTITFTPETNGGAV